MELELQKEHFACYRAYPELSDTHEETAETIVPDYSPDIARIVDVNACLFLRGCEAADGRLSVSGTVKLTLLYAAENAQGLCTLDYAVPFEHAFDGRLPGGAEVSVRGRVCAPEVRMLNPRKIFTRVNVELSAAPYARETLTVCGAVSGQEGYAIETLCERHEVSLIKAVGGKDFVFSDEATLPSGKESIRSLLSAQVRPRVTECKNVGSKVILKGVACVELVYASEEGKLCQYACELPFSQILDGIEAGDGDVSASVALSMTGCEIHTGGEGSDGDGRTVSVKLFLNAFVVLRQTETVCCVTDLYSTAYELDARLESVELTRAPETTVVQQSVREQIDTGVDIGCVLSANVCFGGVQVTQNGERASLRATAYIKVLYLDENGVAGLAERRCEVMAEAAVEGTARAVVANVCAGDIMTNINSGGIEVRFPAEFTVMSQASFSCACLASLSAEACEVKSGETPSLVLRALQEGQTLWVLAKRYRTTIAEILAANELSDESAVSAGLMLLIPCKR